MSPTDSPSAAISTATWSRGWSKPVRPIRPTPHPRRWRPGTSPPGATRNSATTTSTATSPTEQRAAYDAQGRKPVLRLRMPDEDITWHDLVRGATTFAAGTVPDFALTRATGEPLYTLVNPVDDALMKITHVLRGEDLMPSTPRQIALHQALIRIGVGERDPALRAPANGSGGGHQEAVQARPAVQSVPAPRSRIPARGSAELPRAAGLGHRRRPRRLHASKRWCAPSTSSTSTPTRRASTRRRPTPSTPSTSGGWTRRSSPRGCASFFDAHGHDTGLDDAGFATAAELVQTRVVVLSDGWELLKFLNDDVLRDRRESRRARNYAPMRSPVLDSALRRTRRRDDVEHRRDRGGAQGRADRRAGPQAAQGLRPDPGRGHRIDGQPAAVRVDGTAWPASAACTGCDEARDGAARNLW